MKKAFLKLVLWTTAGVVSILLLVLTGSNSYALGFFLVLLIYVVLPCLLLSIRDVLAAMRKNPTGTRGSWLIFHVCAIFAGLIGYGLWRMGVASEHPMAEKQFWLIFILPGLVYLVAVCSLLHTGIALVVNDMSVQLRAPQDSMKKTEDKEL